MPELPEIETLKRTLEPVLVGATVNRISFHRNSLREEIPTEEVKDILLSEPITKLTRRSKYMFVHTRKGATVFHLGMSGQVFIEDNAQPKRPHTHVVFELNDSKSLHFVDPRRFGRIFAVTNETTESHKFIASLGVEPLSTTYLADHLWKESRKRSCPIKSFIMDASVVVGVGNIYASESLYRAKIHPTKKAQRLSRNQYIDLAAAIKKTLSLAIEAGGSTIKDYRKSDGSSGNYQDSFLVYDREGKPCRTCGKKVLQKRLSGRATYYCSDCQK